MNIVAIESMLSAPMYMFGIWAGGSAPHVVTRPPMLVWSPQCPVLDVTALGPDAQFLYFDVGPGRPGSRVLTLVRAKLFTTRPLAGTTPFCAT